MLNNPDNTFEGSLLGALRNKPENLIRSKLNQFCSPSQAADLVQFLIDDMVRGLNKDFQDKFKELQDKYNAHTDELYEDMRKLQKENALLSNFIVQEFVEKEEKTVDK